MKKIIYILIAISFFGCTKSIDIEFESIKKSPTKGNNTTTEDDNTTETDEDSLVGIWEGSMECLTCCEKKYAYQFLITKQQNNKLEGTVRISEVPNKQFYVIFKLDITYNKDDKLITLKTGGSNYILEYNDSNKCGEYCLYNTYVLKLSDDKKHLNGEWTESSNCTVKKDGDPIKLEKK